ncbi:homoserine dehydrogenase [Armatimonadota bacterium]|nr:homoserine dehydrogenase [Armatimonadota bacterium]
MPEWKKPRIEIGILGLGVVGSGTVDLLQRQRAEIERKIGIPFHIKRIAVRNIDKVRAVKVDRSLLTNNAYDVLNDPDIDILCELIGGVEPAKEYVLHALNQGMQVVTANKEMIAKEGNDLMTLARQKSLDFQFEGSVAGGIPIIQPMKNALGGNRIDEVMGIINGTTNYILTRMSQEHADFGDTLREAQARGYAEEDPTNDIEGYDAQYKIAILSSIAFTSRINVNDVHVEGITHITKADITYAEELGYTVKLVGIGRRMADGRLQVRVHPTLLPKTHPLASTNNVYNAILIKGDSVGDVMFYGRGAGSGPTGSAVVGDIMDVCRNLTHGSTGRIHCTCYDDSAVVPMDEVETRHYLRMTVQDKPGALASIAYALGACDISIEVVVQKAAQDGHAEIVWITHEAPNSKVREAKETIVRLPEVISFDNWLRVEGTYRE